MVIPFERVRLFRFCLATDPYPTGLETAVQREGLLLRLETDNDTHWAEASPLPGWSRESIDDVIAAVRRRRFDAFPSLRFACDSLMSEHAAGSLNVPIARLLSGDRGQVIAAAARLAEQPVAAVKLKIGRQSIRKDIELVRQVQQSLRPDQRLRLDANRAWSLADAIRFGNNCDPSTTDYIEEPTNDPSHLEAFYEVTKLPYALDETLIEQRYTPEQFPRVSAFIVKPTLIGGRAEIESIASSAIPIVFSASFESMVGLSHIARLAANHSPDIPAGLDTYRWLRSNVVTAGVEFVDSHISVRWPLGIDECRLVEVPL
ncbi:MAG: o-succinylbenzoate synthase [Planctomycetales bacterium]|nr:o-succinylbenzoate synthase [Planctomycetales bacterium]